MFIVTTIQYPQEQSVVKPFIRITMNIVTSVHGLIMISIIQHLLWVIVTFKQQLLIIVRRQPIVQATSLHATTLKIKSFYQAIRITSIVVTASQHQPAHPVLDTAKQQTGLELEALGIQPAHFTYIMAITGVVLLAATTIPASRGLSIIKGASTATAASAARTSVCVPAFQLRLRSLQSNNQRINHRLLSKIKRGSET